MVYGALYNCVLNNYSIVHSKGPNGEKGEKGLPGDLVSHISVSLLMSSLGHSFSLIL